MVAIEENKPVKKTNEIVKPIAPETLNDNQIEFANMLADPEHRLMTKVAMAEKLGVTRSTIYKWLERKDLMDYTKELLDYYTDGAVADVWKSLIKTATKGNVKAIQLFFEMKQMYVPPNQVAEINSKQSMTNINIISNIPRPPRREDNDD